MGTIETFLFPVLRTAASFIILMIVTLMIGKHINAHKTHYSFALSITIGSIIANMAFDSAIPFMQIFISFLTIVLLFYLFLILCSKSRTVRKWVSGRPSVLIENGKVLEHNMKKISFSLDDLNQQLREAGVFDYNELEHVMLEVSGQLSIKKKNIHQALTKKDHGVPLKEESMPRELIMDGEIIEKNLNETYSKEWIIEQCKRRNVNVQDVFYAVINSTGSLFVDEYKDHLKSPTHVE
ncbi:DUF421 domain-containing protein [Halobacillus litoralis]|uniref:DUF421 domain-containing protein n=1 Tax=Halobacillus litoralis TaxID=45668 RepID=UPI001CD4529F|nr:DUF421 domain-containing protein [Halobacillus litoralis]MCA0971463.1 DUF421 domain-containing protein [Halobacillus litoralis]